VLFEMLTGRRAFDGEDMTDVLGAVVRLEPNWASLPADVPPAVRTLIQRCLVKDRRQRVSDISAARFVLNELGNIGAPAGTAVRVRSGWRRILPAATAAVLTAIIVGGAAWVLWPVPGRPLFAQFSFPLPAGQYFSGTSRQVIAISPDGRNVAYVANSRIYLRAIGELQPREIPGTESKGLALVNPMFAPDGESIAFIELAPPTLKRVSISGGPVSTIASLESAGAPNSATWGPAGILIASRRSGGGIFRVSHEGGVPERLIGVGEDEEAYGPQMLPDGRTILFTLAQNPDDDGRWDKARIVAQSLTDNTRRVLIEGGSDARYLPSGHLLYAVGGTMFAVPFDPASLTLTGAAVPAIVGVSRASSLTGAAQVAVSETGTLTYLPGFATTTASMFRLVLGDGRGDAVPLAMPPAAYVHRRVSPDGRVVAVGRNDGQQSDIWTYELSGKSEIRKLTFGGHNRFPVWSADSRRVTFQSEREGDRAIFWHAADGTGLTERLTKPGEDEEHIPEAWSRDGNRLLFSVAKGSRFSLWLLTLDAKKIERFGRVESIGPFGANFSPDGRWVVYAVYDPVGPGPGPNRGIFVEPFPPTGEKHQVPRMFTDYQPLWSPDGKSIFYVPNAGRPVVAVPITTSPTIAFGSPFEPSRSPRPDLGEREMRGYDFLADGRFISLSRVFGEGTSTPLSGEVRVVINWFEELKRRVPAK
jgi:serine/threonine-protein kinase